MIGRWRERAKLQERFHRPMDERRTEGRTEGMPISFRRALADSGLDRHPEADVEAHADRIVEAARRGVRFAPDDIPEDDTKPE